MPIIPGAYNPGPPVVSGSTFGIELSEQVVSEGTEVPKVVEKCAQAIEAYGEAKATSTLSGLGRILTDFAR